MSHPYAMKLENAFCNKWRRVVDTCRIGTPVNLNQTLLTYNEKCLHFTTDGAPLQKKEHFLGQKIKSMFEIFIITVLEYRSYT